MEEGDDSDNNFFSLISDSVFVFVWPGLCPTESSVPDCIPSIPTALCISGM